MSSTLIHGEEFSALDLLDALAPTWEEDPLWDRVESWILSLPAPALTRIVNHVHWCAGLPTSPSDPCRCLTWVVSDMRCTGRARHGGWDWDVFSSVPESLQAGLDWDTLAETWGVERCRARCQQIAADALAAASSSPDGGWGQEAAALRRAG